MGRLKSHSREAFESFLKSESLLSEEGLARAKTSELETGQAFATVLVNLGLIKDEKLAEGYAKFLNLKPHTRKDFPKKPVALDGLSKTYLKAKKILPLSASEKSLKIAMADPTDFETRKAMEFAFGKKVTPVVAPMGEIEEAISNLYFEGKGNKGTPVNGSEQTGDFERLKELATDAPVIKFVEKAIGEAMDGLASDIHMEAMEGSFRLRFRIDGVLVDRPAPPKEWQAAIISRIKILSNLNIAEKRLPQDGRFKITVRGREVDFRVSTVPSIHGESVVLRLLDRGNLPGNFSALGFEDEAIKPLMSALEKPDGIVLVTGPTGSGKTTTLYSALKLLNSPERKILTVEDPIEYMLEGVNQVQVNPKIGRTFASTLRSFLRQDPDIMLVGEIRDKETAEIAIQASLTGHLVLSTLHTNNAAGALTRLLDMGVEDYLISSTVSAIVGQRLVRKLCPHCRMPHKVEAKTLKGLGVNGKSHTFYKPGGCPRCSGTGYSGRTGIVEVLNVSEEIKALIQKGVETARIEKAALKEGMVPMFQYGLRKAGAGLTSLEEVLRVTREV